MITKNIVIITLLVVIFVFVTDPEITGNMTFEKHTTFYMPMARDFPNDHNSGLNFQLSFPAENFKVEGEDVDYIIFIESELIKDLIVGYDANNQEIFGGINEIRSPKVNIFDGQPHVVTYKFDIENNKQYIMLDYVLVAEGEFK